MKLSSTLAAASLSISSLVNAADLKPLHTSSRWILDSNNQRFKLRCVNWAGHMEAHIPEGLQHNSISNIAQIISNSGFNCVRLTFSIDMALNPNLTVAESFSTLAQRTGADTSKVADLWKSVVGKNSWIEKESVSGAFGKVIDTLGDKGIRVMLDNHVSRASWCCNLTDGNGWWDEAAGYSDDNSRFFRTRDWINGLAAIARFAASHPAVAGVGIRNEIRATLGQDDIVNHSDWYKFVAQGAASVHSANPDLLIAIGGIMSSTDANFLRNNPLDRTPYGDKVVWEWHTYTFSPAWIGTFRNCWLWKQTIGGITGFLLTQNQAYTGPLWLSEFGFPQAGGPPEQAGIPDQEQYDYVKCLVEYVTGNDGDWAIWALQGTYYVRDGQVDPEEGWGLLNKDWTEWKNPKVKELLGDMWKVTQGP